MRRQAIAAAALLLGATTVAEAWGRTPVVVRHRTAIGGWRLDLARDAFSGEIACRLRETHGRAFYQGDAVGFRFARARDVSAAVYRVDGGPPRAWRDDLPELLALDTPLDTGTMANPSRGVVLVPWRLLAAANAIVIQPTPGRRARTFRLGGVRGLRMLALARGCAPAARFIQ